MLHAFRGRGKFISNFFRGLSIYVKTYGRSPFEEPERTESGAFMLGSAAHGLDNQVDGYVQQFDTRGQPKNPAAKAAIKEFRHAKNEVMEAMGVVKRKGIQEIRRRKSADQERLAALLQENSYGSWLKALDSGLALLSLWWLMSLRSRFETFKSFSTLPLFEIVKSEIRLLGPVTFFSSGLLAWFAILPITFYRQRLVDITTANIIRKVANGKGDIVSRQRHAARTYMWYQILDVTLFAIAAPVLMFSDLQILHLIPQLARPSLSSLIPLTRDSPIRLPHFSRSESLRDMLRSGFEVLRSPIVVFWLYDRTRNAVKVINYHIIHSTVPRPDFPDRWSILAAEKGDEEEETIPRLWLKDSPTLFQQILCEAESLLDWFRRWKIWRQEKRPRRNLEEVIRVQSQALERGILFAPDMADRPRPSEHMAREIRRHAARLTWELYRQTPPDDLDAWIDVSRTRPTSSTNTPEPEELFAAAEANFGGQETNDLLPYHELVAEEPLPEPSELDSRPADVAVLVQSGNAEGLAESPTGDIQPDSTHPADENDIFWQDYLHGSTALVTISEPVLEMWEDSDEDITPPPVRRARILTSEDSISRARSRSQSRAREQVRNRGWTGELPRHRVTSLSNYPADKFAYYVSMVLTTVMMLPLESLYLRALARGFLESPTMRPGATAAAAGIRADVRSLGSWFGGAERGLTGRMRYASVMAMMWGLQAVISAGIWGLATKAAIWLGRRTFGWRENSPGH